MPVPLSETAPARLTVAELLARDREIGLLLDQAPTWREPLTEARELLRERREVRAELERRYAAAGPASSDVTCNEKGASGRR